MGAALTLLFNGNEVKTPRARKRLRGNTAKIVGAWTDGDDNLYDQLGHTGWIERAGERAPKSARNVKSRRCVFYATAFRAMTSR